MSIFQPTLFTRSPFELALLNERILELRQPQLCEKPTEGLVVYRAGELSELIDLHSRRLIFCLFWTNVNAVSAHVFQLWKQLATELHKDADFEQVTLAAVPCHRELDLCAAFGIQQADHRTVFAVRGSRKLAAQFGIGDADFYKEWMRM